MFRQVGIGAAAVLTIGLLAAGCGSDGDTIITGSNGLLNNLDSTPFAGLTNNNLAPDGGGFSPNGVSSNQYAITFNCDNAKSDGTFAGDDSAIVLFNVAGARQAVFASYYSGGAFSPPVELEASDRDYAVAADLNGYICMPLNTSAYQSANTSPSAEVNTVRNNDGNWVIVGSFVTKFVLPGQTVNNSSSVGKGARRTVASWVFLKNERTNSLSTSTAVGGITSEFRYGFQRNGDEIATSHTTGAIAGSGGGLAEGTPANNVMSYGIASDGLSGQASWSGANAAPTNGAQAGPSTVVNNTALTNNYSVGEAVSNVTVVFSQIETTASSDTNQLQRATTDETTTGGAGLFLRYRNFNLATLTWGTEARIHTGVDINNGTGSTEAGSGAFANFVTYNNTLIYRYADCSMNIAQGTAVTNTLTIGFQRHMIAAARFVDGGSGAATLATNGVIDVSPDALCIGDQGGTASAPGLHTTTVPLSGVVGIINGSREIATLFDYNGESATQSVYGADEGLGDLSIFYGIADGTASGSGATGSGPNSDRELAVVVLSSTGALSAATSFSAGTNPLRMSGDHVSDSFLLAPPTTGVTTDTRLTDPIGVPCFAMNRTGEWIAVAFTKKAGVNQASAFQTNLYANIYQTFRPTASSTAAGQTGAVAATVQTRVLAALTPLDNSGLTVNAAAPNGNEIPVNAFCFQGKACYRGWQSNKDIVSVFFEQSDGTGDRVFGSRLTVTIGGTSAAPTAPSMVSATGELTFPNTVPGVAAFFTAAPAQAPGTSSFQWINGNGKVTNENNFQSCDSGLDNSGNGGSVYVAFTRIDDATTTDSGSNDEFDISHYGTIFGSGTFEVPARIGTTADTNESAAGADLAKQTAFVAQNNIRLEKVVCLPNNTDIANKPSYPVAGDSTYITTIFTGRPASLVTASGASTPTVVGSNNSSFLIPYARTLRPTNGTASPALNSISTRLTLNVTNSATAPFQLPARLGHEGSVSTDLLNIDCCQNGSLLGVVLNFNNQIWYNATTDGVEWLKNASTGLSNPGLVSNFSSANTVAFTLTCCTNGTGDATAAVIKFNKNDVDNDVRTFLANGSF